MSIINQKEYLKKYLSLGDEKEKSKRRKKRSKIIKDRLKIIDDDIDVPHNINENELNEFLTAEDAPQVCGIVDERPLSMRIDDYRKSDKWKLVGSDDELKDADHSKKNKKTNYDSDLSPSRNKNSDSSDASPPRKTKPTVKRKSRFSEGSPPPRRTRKKSESDASPPRRTRKIDTDVSPPRRARKNSDSDASPPRRTEHADSKIKRKSRFTDASPPRKTRRNSESDNSPPRKPNKNSDSVNSSQSKGPKKLTKTLDGKAAGLQSGKDLKVESVALRKREDDMFRNMSAEISGKDAAPILRDRRTGKKRDLEKEAIEEFEKQQIENAKKEKYDKWGKGLKQVEERRDKIQEELHEMSKPLARYADDEDLEKYLKDQEREGDPMLQYIRKKKKDKAIASGDPKSLKPQYEGEFMPNRFGIPPGHRWDGVDRSNGYEKEWFKVQNSKKAVEEEIYKWSTEDM